MNPHRRFWLAAAVLAPLATYGQKAPLRRIAYLSMASAQGDRQWLEAFQQRLRELGHVPGRSIVLDARHADNRRERLPGLAAELLQAGADVFVVYGISAYPALRERVGGKPIVMTVHADPVGSGLVASLARPGGNVTGLTDGHAELSPKRLEILKEAAPAVSRVGVLFNPSVGHAARQWQLARDAAPSLGLAALPIEIRGAQEIDAAFEKMRGERIDGLVLAPDPTWWVGHERRIAELALKQRLPAIGSVREFAEHGILLSYGTDFTELWRRAADYVDKILNGARPAELPVEHPKSFHLLVNRKTARALGIRLPLALLQRADGTID